MSVFLEASLAFQFQNQEPQTALPPRPTHLDMLMLAAKAQDVLKGVPLRSTLRVAVMAGSIARRLELPQREINALVHAALVYDLGLAKLAADVFAVLPQNEITASENEKRLFAVHALVNARLIGNPNLPDLTALELGGFLPDSSHKDPYHPKHPAQQIIHNHPQLAGWLCERFYLSDDVRAIIETHHELCDGSGYPFGLTQDSIPMGAKILCLVDTVEALLTEVAGLDAKQQVLTQFLTGQGINGRSRQCFDETVMKTFWDLLEEYPDFLRLIAGREIEAMCRNLVTERKMPLSGAMLLGMAEGLADLSDGLQPLYRSEHSRKVARLAYKTAEALEISPEQRGELMIAGLLHDVGLLGVPMRILMKPNTLNESEWTVIRQYPHWSEEILKSTPGFENIAQWVAEHHERMNGRGYPAGKKGFEISVGARILAIADVYEALTASRPYRTHAHEPMDAMPVLGQGRFSQFDNQLVSVLRDVVMRSELVTTTAR